MGRHTRRLTTRVGIAAAVFAFVLASHHRWQLRRGAVSPLSPPPGPPLPRAARMSRLRAADPFDVFVIGGGPAGLYVAVDAAQRGLRVGVAEAADFGGGSSPPLLPGAFPFAQRALRQRDGHWLARGARAWEAMAVWARVAPGLVEESVPTLVPSRHAMERVELFAAAALASLISPFCGPWRPFRVVSEAAMREARVGGEEKDAERGDVACGGVVVRDAVLDCAAATVALARTAEALGATVLNYAAVTNIAESDDKSARFELTIEDTSTPNASPASVRARSVVNCTGAQATEVRSAIMNATPTPLPLDINIAWEQRQSYMVVPRSAVHGGGREPFGSRTALMATSTLFSFSSVMVLPWFDDCLLIGPSVGVATKHMLPSLEERAAQRDFVCEALRAAGVIVERKRVLSSVSKVVPVLRPPADAAWGSDILMKGHHICADPGAVHLFGGTLAFARDTAEAAVDKLLQDTGVFTEPEQKALHPCRTTQLALVGAECKAIDQEDVSALERIRHFVRETYAVRLVDVVARRTHVAYSSPEEALAALPVIADVMGSELNWDKKRKRIEIEFARAFIESVIVS